MKAAGDGMLTREHGSNLLAALRQWESGVPGTASHDCQAALLSLEICVHGFKVRLVCLCFFSSHIQNRWRVVSRLILLNKNYEVRVGLRSG